MAKDDTSLEVLGPDDCRRLLAGAVVGRVVFTNMALPTAYPVTFALDDDGLIFQARDGSELAAAVHDQVVGFEVDEVDLQLQCGWSVTVVGHSYIVSDANEINRLSILPLQPWGPSHRQHFVHIDIETINGWRLLHPEGPPHG